jgi:ribosomal-protein-alanine N-acetyltransferase
MCKINDIKIKKMNIGDLEIIAPTLQSDFDDFWNYNIFKQELENPNSYYICAICKGELIGFAGIMVVLDQADITNIVVKKDFRGNGVGNILLKNLISLADELNFNTITLEVNENNKVAISLYEKFGFTLCGQRKKYYNGKDTALIMTTKAK